MQATRESALGQQTVGGLTVAPRSRSTPPPLVLLLPTVIVLFVLTIYPTVYSFTLSLNEWNMSNRLATWTFVGLGNYPNILADSRFWNAAQVTGTFIFGTVALQLLLGMGIALLLQRQVIARGLLHGAAPADDDHASRGRAHLALHDNPTQGILNYLLNRVGLPTPNWLGSLQTGFIAVMIADIWEWTPFMVLILLAALQTLPQEPFEAAAIDGASAWQAFLHITLPLLRPTIVVAVLIRATIPSRHSISSMC